MLCLSDCGATRSDIAERVGKDRRTIDRVLNTYDWETWSGRLQPRPRARSTSERDDCMLVRAALTSRRTPLADITNDLAITISPRTVQRRLSEAGIKKHIAISKPFLSPAHMKARLDWAMNHVGWTVEDWEKVIWSDESKIEIGKDTGIRWVFRKDDETYNKDCLKPVFKGQRTLIMVWGCFAGGKMGDLVAFPKGGDQC